MLMDMGGIVAIRLIACLERLLGKGSSKYPVSSLSKSRPTNAIQTARMTS